MVLADFGADVLTIEPPNGSRLREAPAFAMWSRGTNSRRLDLTTTAGQERLHEVVADADVMITALEPATADRLGVDGASMCAANALAGALRSDRVRAGPSPERRTGLRPIGAVGGGPRGRVRGAVRRRASRLSHGARGHARCDDGRTARDLCRPPGAGAHRAGAAARDQPAPRVERVRPDALGTRRRSRPARGRRADADLHGGAHPRRCLAAVQPELAATVPGLPRARSSSSTWSSRNAFRTAPHIPNPADARALRAILIDRVRERSWDEWRPVFDADPDISAEPFTWPGDALLHPQLLHTGDSVEVDDPTLGRTRQLGPLFTRSASPATATERARRAARQGGSLLQGVTVLELANWIATPMASSLLTELGARVIKIEPLTGDLLRGYGPVGLKCVQGTQSITLDLKTTEGLAIVHRLVERVRRVGAQLPPGSSGATRHRRRDPARAEPEAHLSLRRVVRLDRADGGATRRSTSPRARSAAAPRPRAAATAPPVPTSSSPTRRWRTGRSASRAATRRTPTSTPRSSSPRP